MVLLSFFVLLSSFLLSFVDRNIACLMLKYILLFFWIPSSIGSRDKEEEMKERDEHARSNNISRISLYDHPIQAHLAFHRLQSHHHRRLLPKTIRNLIQPVTTFILKLHVKVPQKFCQNNAHFGISHARVVSSTTAPALGLNLLLSETVSGSVGEWLEDVPVIRSELRVFIV